jgi:hypothetical protein
MTHKVRVPNLISTRKIENSETKILEIVLTNRILKDTIKLIKDEFNIYITKNPANKMNFNL